jgi:hypothetical protein
MTGLNAMNTLYGKLRSRLREALNILKFFPAESLKSFR